MKMYDDDTNLTFTGVRPSKKATEAIDAEARAVKSHRSTLVRSFIYWLVEQKYEKHKERGDGKSEESPE